MFKTTIAPLLRSYRRPLGSALGVRKSVSIVSIAPCLQVDPVFQRGEREYGVGPRVTL